MKTIHENTVAGFLSALASGEPVPGGGGASALIGAVGVALCSMVANLTRGKKKYAAYQREIEEMISRTSQSIDRLLGLIEQDAEAFVPLSAAYQISKEDPNRDAILEQALVTACQPPLELLKEVTVMIDVIEQLVTKGTKLAVSDVGVSASACCAALEGAVMNVYINTKLMKRREVALALNEEADALFQSGRDRCQHIYRQVRDELRGIS